MKIIGEMMAMVELEFVKFQLQIDLLYMYDSYHLKISSARWSFKSIIFA